MLDKILILCTGNSCRSQMAEAFFRKHAAGRFEAFSAGLEPRPVHPMTIQVLEEIGIGTSGLRSKSIRDFLGKERFRYVIFVCAGAEKNCPSIFPFAIEKLSWPFDDPASVVGSEEQQLAVFRRVRDEIEERVRIWLEQI